MRTSRKDDSLSRKIRKPAGNAPNVFLVQIDGDIDIVLKYQLVSSLRGSLMDREIPPLGSIVHLVNLSDSSLFDVVS